MGKGKKKASTGGSQGGAAGDQKALRNTVEAAVNEAVEIQVFHR